MKAILLFRPVAAGATRVLPTLVALSVFFFSFSARGHEVRPAYLELREEKPGKFSVLWKTPMLGDARLALEPEFSGDAKAITPVSTRMTPGAAIQQWTLLAATLRGQTLRIRGLESTLTDTLVRMEFADGSTWVRRLTAREPAATIPKRPPRWAVAGVYLRLGGEHIVFGVDHLLFVFGLLLIVQSRWMLVKTVTAFTVAHSFTLAMATLGWVSVPGPPLNAAIALSILFLGPEIVRRWRGESSLTIRNPWIVAFVFGLLHGFGFASAMTDAGLSRPDLPLALLFFNLGVEAGQLGFVVLVLALERSFGQLQIRWPIWVRKTPGYVVGSLGACWTIQRTAMLFGAMQ